MKTIKTAMEALGALRYPNKFPEAKNTRVEVPKPSAPAPPQLIARLLSCARLAKEHQALSDPVYQASGEWSGILETTPFKLGESLATMFRDGSTSIGSSYSSRGLTGLKGLIKKPFIIRDVHRDLRVWRAIQDEPLTALEAPDVGSPWGVRLNGTLIYPGVCRAHCFASRIAGLLDIAVGTAGGVVVEIGGGYGELAYRLMKRRPGVRYICFDLPEVLLKSSYFLMSTLPDKRVLLYDEAQCLTPEILSRYDIVLMPNFLIRDFPDIGADVVVNTRSLSEMSREAITDYMFHIGRITRRYFIHENSSEPATWHGHQEIPAGEFPMPESLRLLYTQKSPWWIGDGLGALGRYVEYLYERH